MTETLFLLIIAGVLLLFCLVLSYICIDIAITTFEEFEVGYDVLVYDDEKSTFVWDCIIDRTDTVIKTKWHGEFTLWDCLTDRIR